MENEICIRMKDVKKEYHVADVLVRALQGVSFEVRRGEYITIMGPSGSGKSTLMNMIGCLDRPTSGLVEIGGKNTAEMTEKELAYLRNITVGFVFQQYFLLPSMNILENVMLPLRYQGIDRKESRRMAEEALVKVGLQDRLGHTPSELSGGQKQRVWIAMALAQDTKVLFLDEPTTYLDVRYQLQILKLIQKLNREYGITIVMVLHDINQSLYYSDEIVAMKDGRMIAHGLPEEIISKELVKEVYGVDLTIQSVDGKPFVIPV